MPRGKPPKKPFPRGAANPASRERRPETGAGRKKGQGNLITEDIKKHILNALNNVGGEAWFELLAQRDSRSMAALVRAIIPQKIQTGPAPDEVAAAIRQANAQMDQLTQGEPPKSGKEVKK